MDSHRTFLVLPDNDMTSIDGKPIFTVDAALAAAIDMDGTAFHCHILFGIDSIVASDCNIQNTASIVCPEGKLGKYPAVMDYSVDALRNINDIPFAFQRNGQVPYICSADSSLDTHQICIGLDGGVPEGQDRTVPLDVIIFCAALSDSSAFNRFGVGRITAAAVKSQVSYKDVGGSDIYTGLVSVEHLFGQYSPLGVILPSVRIYHKLDRLSGRRFDHDRSGILFDLDTRIFGRSICIGLSQDRTTPEDEIISGLNGVVGADRSAFDNNISFGDNCAFATSAAYLSAEGSTAGESQAASISFYMDRRSRSACSFVCSDTLDCQISGAFYKDRGVPEGQSCAIPLDIVVAFICAVSYNLSLMTISGIFRIDHRIVCCGSQGRCAHFDAFFPGSG